MFLGLNTGGLPGQGISNGLPELPLDFPEPFANDLPELPVGFSEQAFANDLPELPVGLPESSEMVDPVDLRTHSCCEMIEFQRGDGTRSQPYKTEL